jgi:hypothetical protein
MPYYLEKKNNKFKLHLQDMPEHNFSNKYMTKTQAIKQMQAIEISKRKRKNKKNNVDNINITGGGIFSNIIGKIKNSVKNITNKIQQIPTGIAAALIPTPEKYTSKAETIIKRYGNYGIKSITLRREPVDSRVMTAAHILTQNEIKDLMKKNNVNTLYHLSMVCEVIDNMGQSIYILIEKNDVINLEVIKSVSGGPQMQYMPVSISDDMKLTIGVMLQRTRMTIGNTKFFIYDAINANCGIFLIDILQSNGIYKDSYKDFLYQIPYYNNNISKNSKNKMNILTRMGALFSHLKGGQIKFI